MSRSLVVFGPGLANIGSLNRDVSVVDNEDRKTLLRLKRLLVERLRVYDVILFGSRARGDAAPDSDMDVLVVVDEAILDESREIVLDCAWEAGFDAGIVVAPVVVSREAWENGPLRASLLAQAVREEGVSV
ncbi:MAG TPA: nucleotidyltransferase domain-containing protein [Candidatus Hydrogenedentes bacterium]|nr:nucleotidyltransferase domain-containing protein [Candidatus Hydrogenedentota bacterium]HPG65397.1 nucleotidyltransferase domain-containing protein [Candidatus Hydrogenedentota bacterium]